VTSRVLHLDEAASLARTASGTVYLLGHRIEADTLPDEEGRLAFDALVMRRGQVAAGTRSWLASCKVARWVALPPPDRSDPVAVEAFLARHMGAYFASREAAASSGGTSSAEGVDLGFAATVELGTRLESGSAESGSEASRLPAEFGLMLRATYKGTPVVIAHPEPAELAALIGPRPAEAFRDTLDAWALVAIRGLPAGTTVHALGWRVELEDVWITSAVVRIGRGPMSVITASGHAYGLGSPQSETLGPRLRRHLDFALASWGFEDVRPP
jgi:hypothetical protein